MVYNHHYDLILESLPFPPPPKEISSPLMIQSSPLSKPWLASYLFSIPVKLSISYIVF